MAMNQVLDAVVKLGCTNIDTADVYRDAEDLIGKWYVLALPCNKLHIHRSLYRFSRSPEKRSSIFLATKFGIRGYPTTVYVDGRPEYVREAFEKSLARLQTSYVDLYYLHRCAPIQVNSTRARSLRGAITTSALTEGRRLRYTPYYLLIGHGTDSVS